MARVDKVYKIPISPVIDIEIAINLLGKAVSMVMHTHLNNFKS